LLFFPAIPPSTSNGVVTKAQIRNITTMVPKGNAAVALYVIATVLRKLNVRSRGPQNRPPVNNKFLTCHTKISELFSLACLKS
jgi:hypothetical protein